MSYTNYGNSEQQGGKEMMRKQSVWATVDHNLREDRIDLLKYWT